MAPLGLRHAALGAALLVFFGSWLPVVAITTALLGVQYWYSDRIALSATRATLVGPEEEPKLYAILIRLCAQADMPKPALAVAPTDVPSAYAAGRTPAHSVLCVTTGLTKHLTDEEIEAVLARELSRLAHRNVVVITIASLMPVLACLLLRIPFHAAPLNTPDWQTNPTLGTTLIALVLTVYALGFLLVKALARHRELAADRAGATLTGQPSALARALTKLDVTSTAIPTRDLRTPNTDATTVILPGHRRTPTLLSTHPNPRTRLDQLAKLTTALESPERNRQTLSDRRRPSRKKARDID